MADPANILVVSPYHGGSHRAWAEGYQAHSSHQVELLTLPARYWKWRMHGGAVTLAREFQQRRRPDLVLATDMLDLTTFKSLSGAGTAGIPMAVFMHENQLTYPLPEDPTTGPMRRQGGERDLHYAFINFVSMLAAERVYFNSSFHRDSLLEALPGFLRHFPEERELHSVDEIRAKSEVMGLGVNVEALDAARVRVADKPPLILWNQRWEYDKNPVSFFEALEQLQLRGARFRLAVCGESFQRQPEVFETARRRFRKEIVHWGYASLEHYRRLLWESSVTVSTANHEFFGISVIEAALCETLPLLPRRLSYPELLPEEFHADCLYETETGLVARLGEAVEDPSGTRQLAVRLAPLLRRFDWRLVAATYDEALARLLET